LGLRWKDIDSSNYTATVSETKIVGDKGVEIKSPKTEESIRRVSLPPFVIEELERYKVKLRFAITSWGCPGVLKDWTGDTGIELNK
jgi:integrase